MPVDAHSLDPGRLAAMRDPYPVYAYYREHDPVHLGLPPGGTGKPSWYVFRYDDVAEVLLNPVVGRNLRTASDGDGSPTALAVQLVPDGYPTLRAVLGDWLLRKDPPRHTYLRSVISAPLVPAAARNLRPEIVSVAEQRLRAASRQPEFDLVADFAEPLPMLILTTILGVPANDAGWLTRQMRILQDSSPSRRDARKDTLERAEAAVISLVDYFRGKLQKRRRDPGGDVISLMAQAGGITDEEIIATCTQLLVGTDNVTNLISKGTLVLLEHPQVCTQLRSQPELWPRAVEELIRFDGPAQVIGRFAHADIEVADRTIRGGERLILVLASANRDPRRFRDPDVFNPERQLTRHCGFGLGYRYCPGGSVARTEAEVALMALVERLPQLRLVDKHVEYLPDLTFHGPARLRMAWT